MFTQDTFKFLAELAANNNREWFEANKPRYEAVVREPALDFIEAMAPRLASFAPHFVAEPRKAGGSLMRVFRDTRFSRDKTPYKTNIGIQFRHALGKDVHAPGFYVHIATDECFFGVGCWHPDPTMLGKIRDHIAEKPERWFAVRDDKNFTAHWTLGGNSLMRPPRGYATDHPALEDLKRKDFVGMAPLSDTDATGSHLIELTSARFAEAVPLMRFLCEAVNVQF